MLCTKFLPANTYIGGNEIPFALHICIIDICVVNFESRRETRRSPIKKKKKV
jgi:hypothetical protein